MKPGKKGTSLENSYKNIVTHTINNSKNYCDKKLLDYSNIMPTSPNPIYYSTPNSMHSQVYNAQLKKNKKIQESFRCLSDRIDNYQKYYIHFMEMEKLKYQKYFQQIHKIIQDQYELGIVYIHKQIERINDTFENKRINLKQMKESVEFKDLKWDKRIQFIEGHHSIEVDLFQVKVNDLSNFRQDIRKYLLKQFQINCCPQSHRSERQNTINSSVYAYSQCDKQNGPYPSFAKQNNNKQICSSSQTEEIPTNQVPSEKTEETEEDDFLNCDEQLGRKMSASTRRRRKYEVGRRDVIKEEDESQESNSIISEPCNQ